MGALFHIVPASDWSAAQAAGALKPGSLASQGFVHLSERGQVLGTANRFFRGRRDLLLLEIDAAKLSDPVRYEEGEPGVLFPHLYGPLPVSAVVSAKPLVPGGDGTFTSLP
jgi:uncharacterized protein (DUF952 family)